jgi:hypothetical protein
VNYDVRAVLPWSTVSHFYQGGRLMSIGLILLILLILALVGALPTWGYSAGLGLWPVRDRRGDRHHPGHSAAFREDLMAKSIGAERVRASFNPSDKSRVSEIKQATARLIDICEENKDLDPRLAALAQTAYEEAAMWAVKLVTTEEK